VVTTLLASLPAEERPREKLLARGPAALSDQELLAVALGRGSGRQDVLGLAGRALRVFDERNGGLSSEHLMEVPGLGPARAAALTAMVEFSRRRIRPEGIKIRRASDLVPLLAHLADRRQEHFVSVTLSGAHEVIAIRVVTIGLLNTAHVHPREVFSDAITDRAAAIIVAHNHPSGDLSPSAEDLAVTKMLRNAGALLGIPLLDHIIVSRRGHVSLQESGSFPPVTAERSG